MSVELDLQTAKTLLDACPRASHDAAVLGAIAKLARQISAEERVSRVDLFDRLRRGETIEWSEFDEIDDDELESLFEDAQAAQRGALDPVPQWEYVARATREIRRAVETDAKAIADVDRIGSYLRDRFDALGLSIRHEATQYVAIVTVALMVELADNGRQKTEGRALEAGEHEGAMVEVWQCDPGCGHPLHASEEVPDSVVKVVARVAQSLTAALIPYLPEEARR